MSDKEKFTPGPWSLGEYDRYDKHICIKGRGQYLGEATTDDIPFKEGEANARLMAASPDLYEALQHLVGVAAKAGLAGSTYNPALQKARAALSKATEGVQP